MTELCRNRLIVDQLTSIPLCTLRYVRLGLAANPESMRNALKTWRMLQRAVKKRDIESVLETAQRRIEASRDAALRAFRHPPNPLESRGGSRPGTSKRSFDRDDGDRAPPFSRVGPTRRRVDQ